MYPTRITISDIGKEPFNEGFCDKEGNPVDGLEAIFPIVSLNEENPYKPIGTGFFISSNGFFATAKHVVVDNEYQIRKDLFGIQILRSCGLIIPRRIGKVVCHETADVAVGFLFDPQYQKTGVPLINKNFVLTNRIPDFGEEIGIFAFPKPDYKVSKEAYLTTLYCQGNKGLIEDFFSNGRDKTLLPNRCYQTSIKSFGGASGGPVCDKNGEIFGVNSTGWDGDSISFVSSIQDLLDLKIRDVITIDGRNYQILTILDMGKLGFVNINETSI